MLHPFHALSLVGLLLLAGCVAPREPHPQPSAEAPETATFSPGWPALEQARLRPGIPIATWEPGVVGGPTVESGMNGCTANFVFRSPDNRTLYLGTAAHCVEGTRVGDPYPLLGGAFTATLAYSSWATLRERGEGNDTEASPLRENDFALLRIDPADRGDVHPAMLAYGGPTGLAHPSDVRVGEGTLMYGSSPLRGHQASVDAREGCVSQWSEWAFRQWWPTGVLPGDSGSPVLLASGEALGVMVRIGGLRLNQTGGLEAGNGLVTNLAPALQYAREAAGLDVELATWPLLREPTIEEWPACPPGESTGALPTR